MIDEIQHIILQYLSYSLEEPMLFTRLSFWVFLTFVIGVYSIFYKRVRIRNIYLLLISLFFYYKTGGVFFVLLIFSCISNYSFGFIIGTAKHNFVKLFSLVAGISINLGLLAYFKYAFFFTEILNRFTGNAFESYNWLAHWWNLLRSSEIDTSEIILPIGISFFTFQAISYLVDVYQKRSHVVRNLFDFSFYLSFFPQLVAGPIVRASAFVPQLYRQYSISKQEFGHALFLILAGLVKKIIVSDYLALNFVDRIFEQPGNFSGIENLMAVYAYALQIYADFSGYTDIAIGVALLLGFKIPINFNSPYKAKSLSDFWHRWHISLSTWLRDYLYIPLGGNRKGKIRTYVNLFVTMLLGGLWHGANLRFVLWGALHGGGLMLEKLTMPLRKRLPANKFIRFLSVFITFNLVAIGWMFFRAKTIDDVVLMMNQILLVSRLNHVLSFIVGYPFVIGIMVFGYGMHFIPHKWQETLRGSFIKLPLWVKGIIILLVLYVLHLFFKTDVQPFIYFRF